jgi:hypothetical protein
MTANIRNGFAPTNQDPESILLKIYGERPNDRKRKRDNNPTECNPNNPNKDKNDKKRKRDNTTPNEKKNPFKNDKPNEDDLNLMFFSMLLNGLSEQAPDAETKPKVKEPVEPDCKNPLCNHKTLEEDPTPFEMEQITTVTHVTDLIKLGKAYHCKKNKEYHGINLRILCNLVAPLTELNSLIGMTSVKENITNQILFFVQGFNKNTKCNQCTDCAFGMQCVKNQDDMLHTVITGPPGVGKTQLGKILAKVYKEMGILSKGHFKLVTRSDLVGKYLGHTAAKTQEAIDECKGGVMFIDEAYALGNKEGRDSFSKECLDTLNQNLSENRDFLCIIAGYKDALDKCFFSANEGLRRRFTFRYDIEGYSGEELKQIFLLKVQEGGWKTEFDSNTSDNELNKFFKSNVKAFPNFGGDIETFFLKCKIAHSRNLLLGTPEAKRVLTMKDIKTGFGMFASHRKGAGQNDSPNIYS